MTSHASSRELVVGCSCDVWPCIVVEVPHSPLLSPEFCRNPVQLLAVDSSSDGCVSWENLPVDDPPGTPPDTQHRLSDKQSGAWRWHARLAWAQPLTAVGIVGVCHPLLVAGDQGAEPVEAAPESRQIPASVGS